MISVKESLDASVDVHSAPATDQHSANVATSVLARLVVTVVVQDASAICQLRKVHAAVSANAERSEYDIIYIFKFIFSLCLHEPLPKNLNHSLPRAMGKEFLQKPQSDKLNISIQSLDYMARHINLQNIHRI